MELALKWMKMKTFMRIVLDEMVEDPDPIASGEQATVVGYADAGSFMVSWENGRSLSPIPDVDKYHIVSSPDEIKTSFEWLNKVQKDLREGESSKCPRCGKPFDAHRGAHSRHEGVSICDTCGQQEDVEVLDDWYIVKIWQGRQI